MARIKITSMLSLFSVILAFLFLYAPVVVLVAFSFNTKNFPAPFEEFTLRWYYELFHHAELWYSFFNSLTVALSTVALSLGMGLLLIYYQVCGGKVRRVIPYFYGNMIVPDTIIALSLISFFSFCGVSLGFHTLLVAHVLIGLGFVVPILYLRYKSLDPRLIEASQMLGASHLQTFFKIIIPQLMPAIVSVGLLVFVISFDDFIFSFFCSGPTYTTLSLYLASSIKMGISPIVNALSALLLMFTTAIVIIFLKSQGRKVIG